MKVGYKKLGLVLGAVVAVALLPARADAQLVSYSPVFWSFEGGAGIALPMGDLGDSAESGAAFSVAASYFLNPRLALRAEGGLNLMGTSGPIDPDLQIWTFSGGIEYHLVDPTGNTTVAFDLGLGGATFDTGIFQVSDFPNTGDTATGAFQNTYLAANGGIKLGYNFARNASTGTPMATIYIQGDFQMMFADAADSALYTSLNNQSGFDTVYMIPVTAGFRINIP